MIAGVVVVLLVLVAVAAFLLYTPPAQTTSPCPDGKLKIGVILSQTGAIAEIGNNMVNAVKMKADEINAAGGIKIGTTKCTAELLIEDDGCSAGTAKPKAEKLVNINKVQVIVGNSCSSACLAIDDVASLAKVPQITPSCTSPVLTQRPWIFRTTSSDAFQSVGMVDLVKALNKANRVSTKVVVFSMNNAYGKGIHDAVVKNAKDGGLTVLKDDTYDEDATDFTAQLTALKSVKPAGETISIMLTSYDKPGEVIFTNAEQLGMNTSNGFQWISNDGIVDASALLDNPAMVGLWGTKPTARPGLPNYDAFAKKYNSTYGKMPTVFSPEAYDALGAAAAAIEMAGAYDGTKVKAALNAFTGSSCFVGVTGDKCWDAAGDLDAKGAYYAIYHVEGSPVAYKICTAYWDGTQASMGVQKFNADAC